ncbi:hypothetical protein QJQ45_009694 [Haematococcus lacustris]|nr:hypothetical protein QJQ45_009694 [Haematococcus lacustris]
MAGAGARLIELKRGQPIQVEEMEQFRFETYEVMALCMNVLRKSVPEPADLALVWKSRAKGKKALARGLVTADWAALEAALLPVALAAQAGEEAKKVRRLVRMQDPARDRDLTAAPLRAYPLSADPNLLTEVMVAWCKAVRCSPAWRQMGPVLESIMEVDPTPMIGINRDGKAAEAWACQQLYSSLPPGWGLLTSSNILTVQDQGQAYGQQPFANILLGQQGVKGEADALLMSPDGLCQSVVEVKIGGNRPFKALYNDLRKLLRLIEMVEGREATLEGGDVIRFASPVRPLYLVVRDTEQTLDAQEVIEEAERSLLKINVSMALGSPSSWQSGVKLLQVQAEESVVAVPGEVVRAMQKRVSKGFFSLLQQCEVYDMAKPEGASWPRGTDQLRGRVVLVDEHRTTWVSSAVYGQQPCEKELDHEQPTRPAGWKPPAGQVEYRLLRPAWSQQRDQPVRGLMWYPVVAPRKPPQAPGSSQAATQPAASEPGHSTPPPAKCNKCTKAEQEAEPTQPTKGKGKAQGKAAKAKPAPQPGRWVNRDCSAALNMQRIGESRWRPLELCYWPEQGALPAKGKEYPGLGNKRVRDRPPKAQQQQQAVEAQ